VLDLPILNVRLNACSKDWQQMTPVEQGRHCVHCNRTVIDFTTRTQVDLEAAFQTALDGHVCGQFQQSQLASKPQLRYKLRRFLVALILICGLGLTSGEAWAQMRQAARMANCASSTELVLKTPQELNPVILANADEPLLAPLGEIPMKEQLVYRMVSEMMPVYKNGGSEGLKKLIQENLKYPVNSMPVGKVFISFVVTKTGKVKDLRIQRGIEPAADAEALRVMQLMGPWIPGSQLNHPVDVSYTVPIFFEHE
jgi:protein TonB